MRNVTGTGIHRHPITFLVEACDDLVYCTGDIEDAVKKGLLTWEELKVELIECSDNDPLVAKVIENAQNKEPIHFRIDGLETRRYPSVPHFFHEYDKSRCAQEVPGEL